jgi:2-oxoacid:acceptor oxidoreductase gamma subunit (pyruvate/2-ketoisovalerate family)/2-oxoacid:acceptor oxidoreductase delta subunit (pyruvate/2-ketoisovalerate family)
MNIKGIFEIRGHARGGQGMVTAFEILAKIFSYRQNYEVQAFPFFGVERTGAPIQAFLRISPQVILNRSNIYVPNLVVVFDEGLIEQTAVFDGLAEGGMILINTDKDPSFYKGKAKTIFTVAATNISVSNKLGSKSLPIVNAAMIGAILKILDAPIADASEIIKKEVPSKPEANAQAAETSYQQVLEFRDPSFSKTVSTGTVKKGGPTISVPSVPYWDKAMSMNKTGNWRVMTPEYLDRQPPCTNNCPAGTDVRTFVKLAGEHKFGEAYQVISAHNPFPSVCGRVCPHFCQQNCNRKGLDEEVNIGSIERFLGDKHAAAAVPPAPLINKEKIAVIGSGPAGLTAALRLRQNGYAVSVFEASPKAGGMMRTGIPEFRLPEKVLDREIKNITAQGVKLILNKKVSVGDLKKDFSAIIIAAGLPFGTNMEIPGEEHCIEGITFLKESKFKTAHSFIRKGEKVAVLGGGNTAIDVARTVLRLGGHPVIYYRRTREEMPAIAHEVEEALKEGVKIEFLLAPLTVEKNRKGAYNLRLAEMKLSATDTSGRRKVVKIKGSERKLSVNKIIKAIGQSRDEFAFSGSADNIRVFSCGDLSGGGTVAEAIGSGNETAVEVNAFLRKGIYEKAVKSKDIVSTEQINFAWYLPTPGNPSPFKKVKKLLNDFSEVVQGLPAKTIVKEASRCLHCGDCFKCGNCFNFCPDAAIHIDEENRLRIDYDYCKGCGICVHECPCSAVQYKEEKELTEN